MKSFKVKADALSKTEIEYKNSFANSWFAKFNSKYFNNKLKDLDVRWVSDLEPNACFSYRVDVFQRKVIPVDIQLNKDNITRFDMFRNSLVHEMLHYYVDCYLLNPTDSEWFESLKLFSTKGDKDKAYLNVIGLGEDKCHLGNWELIARELNSKYSELNITAFGSKDIGLQSKKVDFDNLHLVCVRFKKDGRSIEKYKTYDKEKFNEILKRIKEYKSKTPSNSEYYFYELELDKNKLSTSGIEISIGNESFNESFIKYLNKSGVIKKGVKLLGKTNVYKPFYVV